MKFLPSSFLSLSSRFSISLWFLTFHFYLHLTEWQRHLLVAEYEREREREMEDWDRGARLPGLHETYCTCCQLIPLHRTARSRSSARTNLTHKLMNVDRLLCECETFAHVTTVTKCHNCAVINKYMDSVGESSKLLKCTKIEKCTNTVV